MEDPESGPLMRVIILLLLATPAFAQTADEWMFRGDFRAERGEHEAAAIAYEHAWRLDPALRPRIAPRLGRQLLWSDQAPRAVPLLAEALAAAPDDCELRSDYGLALAWSGQPAAALEEYGRVVGHCPPIANQARLRAAMALRWLDRPSGAAAHYREVVRSGTERERAEAETGLAHVLLMTGRHRAALEEFDRLTNLEGAAIAAHRLGDAKLVEAKLASVDDWTRDLLDLRDAVAHLDDDEARPAVSGFRDADGTTWSGVELGLSRGWRRRGRGEIGVGRGSLSDDARSLGSTWVDLRAEHRWSRSVAGRAAFRLTSYEAWRPLTADLRGVWTPSDALRVDASLARVAIADNIAAIDHELTGTHLALSADRRSSGAQTWTAGADVTRWSEGNTRTRLIGRWQREFEGVPRLTLEFPLLLQFYDEPFAFALFSPGRYVELGPGLNVYRRVRRDWNVSAYGRAGAQREESGPWRALGAARVSVERDLRDQWAIRAAAGWSNSNVAGTGGFERTSLRLEFVKRF